MVISSPTNLTLAYLALAGLWQLALFKALPNVGMGGLAVMYLVWPLLVLTAAGLWFVMRKYPTRKTLLFVLTTLLMLAGSLAVHPQDSQINLADKLKRLVEQLAAV